MFMELNQNEQLEVQVAENAVTEQPVKPEKTGKDKAIGALSKVFAILGFIIAVGCLLAITTIVLMYNVNYGMKTITSQTQLTEFLMVADTYKGYATTIIYTTIPAIVCGIVALILNKIQAKKGFGCTFVKVFGIIAIAAGCLAIANCGLNYYLFGRYRYL